MSTISPSILATIDDFTSSATLWNYLANRFSSLSQSHLHELRAKLNTFVLTTSVSDYLKSFKDLTNKLAAVSDPLRESDMVFHTLNRLPSIYNAFKTAIHTRPYPIEFSELASLLEAEEVNIARDNKSDLVSHTTALAAHPTRPSFSSNSGSNYSHRSGPRSAQQHGWGNFYKG